MRNEEIARIFFEMADILEMQGVQWKPRAYRKAARTIENLTEDISAIAEEGRLDEIPGVGERLAAKIDEFLRTGKIAAHEKLKGSAGFDISKIMEVPGIGAKKAKKLHDELGIRTAKDLETAARQHRIAKLEGFGDQSEEDILESIKRRRKSGHRMPLSQAYFTAQDIIAQLKDARGVLDISAAGSLRRMRETIGDVDILVSSKDPQQVMERFTTLPDMKKVLASGTTKSSIILTSGLQVDLRVIEPDRWGSAMQYFTGSKDHNIELRKIAIRKGYKLSEYGLFKGDKLIASKTEEDIYRKLGMPLIPPELRESRGELDAAISGKLPRLINREDIRGDFHVHTKYSDGADTVLDMAIAAKALGYSYICFSDHSKSEHIAHGMDETRIHEYIREIRAVGRRLKGIRLIAGCEVDILADGTLDFDDSILRKLDLVVASVHSDFKMTLMQMTERICKAMENKHVNILGHPTGRIIGEREPYAVDLDTIFTCAKDNDVAMEINSLPDRLDLKDTDILEAKKIGLKFCIDTDAHSIDHLNLLPLGLAQARRGWLEKKDVLNTHTLPQLSKIFKKVDR